MVPKVGVWVRPYTPRLIETSPPTANVASSMGLIRASLSFTLAAAAVNSDSRECVGLWSLRRVAPSRFAIL